MKEFDNSSMTRKVFVGLIIIAIGLVVLVAKLGIVPHALSRVLISWPMILIVIGLLTLDRRRWIGGAIILVVGLVFLTPKVLYLFDIYYSNFTDVILWPALLILIGIYVIFRGKDTDYGQVRVDDCSTGNDGRVKYEYVFDGADSVYPSEEFKGGRIKVLFGGMTLDLRNAELPAGDTILYIDAVFGGVTLKVPADWKVEIRPSCFAGGYADKRNVITGALDRRLIIYGNAVFGGGSIESR